MNQRLGLLQGLMKYVDDEAGTSIRNRALDSKSLGVSKQSEMRSIADDDGFVEDHLWTGIGRARSGCGAALVGDPDQIVKEIKNYMDMGIRAFIFSDIRTKMSVSYLDDMLPQLNTCSLPEELGRIPQDNPATPLGAAKRS